MPYQGSDTFTVRPKASAMNAAGTKTATIRISGPAPDDKIITVTFTLKAVPVVPVGDSAFKDNNVPTSMQFTAGGNMDGFNATTNFDYATLDGTRLNLGTPGTPGTDGSVEDGSIILTLNQEKLSSLRVGEHTLTVFYKGGVHDGTSASTTITVRSSSPKTDDSSLLNLWITLTAVSLFGALLTMRRKGRA